MKTFETAQNAEKEIDSMKKELEDVVKPIMSKLYGQAGAEGGMPDMSQMPGGMPDMSQMPDMKPTVEEVIAQCTKNIIYRKFTINTIKKFFFNC